MARLEGLHQGTLCDRSGDPIDSGPPVERIGDAVERVPLLRPALERYLDCNGVAFEDYRTLLPGRVSDWPPADRIKNRCVLESFAVSWEHCQLCGATPPGTQFDRLHIHHIFGGTRGRSDESTNLIRLCSECHDRVQGNSTFLPVVLWAKWRTEKETWKPTIDWVKLAILRRQHLPTPKPDARWLEEYERNRSV